MASSSDDPPNENPQNPVSQAIQTNNDHQDAKLDSVKDISPPSVFVNSEPIREDQVQNAVKFLSHPKVRGSPVIYRRSFLERKGLTKEEIDEAFKRVPDSSPNVTTTQSVVPSQDGQTKSSLNIQQQPPAQALHPASVGRSKTGILSSFHWYHGVLAVSFLMVSGAGAALLIKKTVIPRFKTWIRSVLVEEDEAGAVNKDNVKPSAAEEAAAAAKSAAAAAADIARATQEILATKTEEKRCFEELIYMLNLQVHEMKSMSSAIHKLEAGQNINGRLAVEEQTQRVSRTSSRHYTNGNVDIDSRSVRSASPPASIEPSAAPHPKSYMEIMAMIQRGEKPSNIREINDAPPDPSQPISNPRLAPKLKPWDVNRVNNGSVDTYPAQVSTNGTNYDYQDNQLNGDDPVPWWQKKNVRITEIETGDEQKLNERPVQRSWVPPQPPPVALPEAAAAIRQPKKASSRTDPMTDDQVLARSADVTDELQKVTQMSESGGLVEANGENPTISSSEISSAETGSYVEA